MDKLEAGHRHFLQEIFPRRHGEFHLLAEGQRPEWLFISCSDSRVVPDLILGTDPGDLFIVRNAGNVVPVGGAVDGSAATIEYAVEAIGVRHAIVCGHSDCGAVKAALSGKKGRPCTGMPLVSQWLERIEPAFACRQPERPSEGESAELAALIRSNVVAQLAHLKAQPAVARAMAAGRLTAHGWYYDILTGRIEEYDESRGLFFPWSE